MKRRRGADRRRRSRTASAETGLTHVEAAARLASGTQVRLIRYSCRTTNGTGAPPAVRLKGRSAKLPGGLVISQPVVGMARSSYGGIAKRIPPLCDAADYAFDSSALPNWARRGLKY